MSLCCPYKCSCDAGVPPHWADHTLRLSPQAGSSNTHGLTLRAVVRRCASCPLPCWPVRALAPCTQSSSPASQPTAWAGVQLTASASCQPTPPSPVLEWWKSGGTPQPGHDSARHMHGLLHARCCGNTGSTMHLQAFTAFTRTLEPDAAAWQKPHGSNTCREPTAASDQARAVLRRACGVQGQDDSDSVMWHAGEEVHPLEADRGPGLQGGREGRPQGELCPTCCWLYAGGSSP